MEERCETGQFHAGLRVLYFSIGLWREYRPPGNHASLPGPPGSRFLLASEPTELQARAFEPFGRDRDRDSCKSVTA